MNNNGKKKKKGVKGLQSKNQVEPRKFKLDKSVPSLFKDKMLEKLKPENLKQIAEDIEIAENIEIAKDIDHIKLSDLKKIAKKVCDEIEKEKERKGSYAEVDTDTLMSDYNLIETFILRLFIDKKFIDDLGRLTTRTQQNEKKLNSDTEIETPIIEYFKPYFKKYTFVVNNKKPADFVYHQKSEDVIANDQQLPEIIKNVFENFCIKMVREKENVSTKLYRINKGFIAEDKQEEFEKDLEQRRKNAKISKQLRALGLAIDDLRIPHTQELVDAVNKAYYDKDNDALQTAKDIIGEFKNTKEDKIKKKGGMFKTEYINNNNLLDGYLEYKSKNQRFNIENKEFNIKSDLEDPLNKKRQQTQNIEVRQNNKKFKQTDNNNFIQPQAQPNFNPLLDNLNSPWLIQQWSDLSSPWFYQQWRNLSFTEQQLEIRRIINDDIRIMNLLNSAPNIFSKNK